MIHIKFPRNVRCVIALTYDTDMAGGYSPDGVCHGRTAPFLKEYMMKLCATAEEFGVKLHFFQIGNGLEWTEDVGYLKEILKRGHIVDSHTYSHMPLITEKLEALDEELRRTNELFKERLAWESTVLRGPGGYQEGLKGHVESQKIILKNGFRWVSSQFERVETLLSDGMESAIKAPSRNPPYVYPTGLVEFPVSAFTDRQFFDIVKCVDEEAYSRWRKAYGHKPVERGWKCPWTAPHALDEWIEYNLSVLDYVYENRLFWTVGWHPYSHYLHDPENLMLTAFLKHASAKPEKVLILTLRDVAKMVEEK